MFCAHSITVLVVPYYKPPLWFMIPNYTTINFVPVLIYPEMTHHSLDQANYLLYQQHPVQI